MFKPKSHPWLHHLVLEKLWQNTTTRFNYFSTFAQRGFPMYCRLKFKVPYKQKRESRNITKNDICPTTIQRKKEYKNYISRIMNNLPTIPLPPVQHIYMFVFPKLQSFNVIGHSMSTLRNIYYQPGGTSTKNICICLIYSTWLFYTLCLLHAKHWDKGHGDTLNWRKSANTLWNEERGGKRWYLKKKKEWIRRI